MMYRVERLCEEDGMWYAWGTYEDLTKAVDVCSMFQRMGTYARVVSLH